MTGLVLDDDGETYRARIAVRAFSAADWHRIERALAAEAIHAAKLLAGDLPADLDEILARFGLSLFPTDLSDIALECSCPGWQKPCGHLAATCYVLAESFDADPFGILAWRGRGREELLDNLRTLRVSAIGHVGGAAAPRDRTAPAVSGFWTAGPRLPPPPEHVAGHRPPTRRAAGTARPDRAHRGPVRGRRRAGRRVPRVRVAGSGGAGRGGGHRPAGSAAGAAGSVTWCAQWWWLPSWPRISPGGYKVLWTLTYVTPARIAATSSANSCAAMP